MATDLTTQNATADIFDFGSRRLEFENQFHDEYDMESLGSTLSFLPIVDLDETETTYVVYGFWAERLQKDIQRHWGTARVSNNLFIDLTTRTFTIHKFYALEIDHMMAALIANPKTYTSRSTLQAIRDILGEKTWLNKVYEEEHKRELNYNNLKRLNLTLLDSQYEWLDTVASKTETYNLNGQVLAAPPGTGKTVSGYATHLVLEADLTIILAPKNTVEEVWEETIESRFKKKPKYWLSTSGDDISGNEEFLICHYEYLKHLMKEIHKLRRKKKICVWIDESHHFNEIKSTRTQNLIRLCQELEPTFVGWASGTPFKAMGSEVVPILYTIDPTFNEEVAETYTKIFGSSQARAVDILQKRIGTFTFKVDKKTVVDVPVEENDILVKVPDDDRYLMGTVSKEIRDFVIERAKYYKELRSEFKMTYERLFEKAMRFASGDALLEGKQYQTYVHELHTRFNMQSDMWKVQWCKAFEEEHIYPNLEQEDKKEYRFIISRHKTLILVIRGEALGQILGKKRIECFKEVAKHSNMERVVYSARKKTMIFTDYVEVAKEAYEYLTDLGIGCVLVIGETNKDFEKIIGRFKKDPRIKVVIATYKSLSTGVPVTEASDVLALNKPFRGYIWEQATSRVNRLGQDGPVRFTTFILDTGTLPNLSSRNVDIMTEAQEMVDSMLGINTEIPATAIY